MLPGYAAFALVFVALTLVAGVAMHPLWRGRMDVPRFGFVGLARDPAIRRLLLIGFLNAAPVAVTSSLFLFFVEDRLGQPELAGLYLLAFFVAAVFAAPLWARWAARAGAERVLAIGMGLSILAFGWAYTLGSGDGMAFLAICIASGAALGADMTLLARALRRTGGGDRRERGRGRSAFGPSLPS